MMASDWMPRETRFAISPTTTGEAAAMRGAAAGGCEVAGSQDAGRGRVKSRSGKGPVCCFDAHVGGMHLV